ncbi:MAG TPA: hypothetical protein DCS43_11185 [Verrucomicrobia bacterium]|nr:hypothetical protein [Verrucomicrobiota bacterium]
MNEAFWEKYPKAAKIRCIEMKARAQERIARETRGLDYDQLFAYFREASNQFWRDLGHVYPEASPTPMAVKEPTPPNKPAKLPYFS